jgi:branched-chain amino acid transport system permease protein
MAVAAKDTSVSSQGNKLSAYGVAKDLIGTAIITLLILTPIVTYKTTMAQGVLFISSRWELALWLTFAVVAVRAAFQFYVWNKPAPTASAVTAPTDIVAEPKRSVAEVVGPHVATALLIFALVLPALAFLSPWGEKRTIDLGIYILTYIMLGWGLNVVVGLAGLLDLGYVAFYAVGAYAYALLSTVYFPYWFGTGIVPWAFYITLPVAGLLAATWGVILGFPVLRLRGDYLAIVTLAFGEMIRLVLINWFDFTHGPQGIEVPKATFFGLPFKDAPGSFSEFFGIPYNRIHFYIFLYYVILAMALITYFVTKRLRRLPIGRAWEALREDEIACRSLGINTTTTKLTAFAIGAMFGGFAGSFFAARQGFVSPESFVYIESALILAIVVLGGLGSQIGIVFSAIAIMGSFEVFREMDFMKAVLPSGTEPIQFRMLAVGLAMVLMMRFRPRGFVTKREPTVFLKEKKSVSGDLVAEGHG